MKLLKTIKHNEVFPEVGSIEEIQFTKFRKAVRVVAFDKEGNIALNYYLPKESLPNGEYGLPGGGVEEGEEVIEAVRREAIEEVGCKIKEVKDVGMIEEYIIKEGNHRPNVKQEVYCFTAKIDGEKGEPQLTEREKSDGLTVAWKNLDEAISLLTAQDPSFTRTRGLIFLEEVQNIL